jgi:hypothetical protein
MRAIQISAVRERRIGLAALLPRFQRNFPRGNHRFIFRRLSCTTAQIEQRHKCHFNNLRTPTYPVLVARVPTPNWRLPEQCADVLAKARERQLATDVLAKLDLKDICEKVDVAGAGFLNFRLSPFALAAALASAAKGEHLFFDRAAQPRTIVIDFSSPNVAKPMHVGHIRSTVLGDSLARIFRLLGHRVITDNHLGDWGTQFGMLIVGWKSLLTLKNCADPLAEMERIYKRSVVNGS